MHRLTGSVVAYIQMVFLWDGLALFPHHRAKDPGHTISAWHAGADLSSVLTDLSPVLGGGSVWRINFQENQSYYVMSLTRCHREGKISQWAVYVFVSTEEKDTQALRERLACQHDSIMIVCCGPDWPVTKWRKPANVCLPRIHQSQRSAWCCNSFRLI